MTALPTSLRQRVADLEERLAETALLPRFETLEKIRERGAGATHDRRGTEAELTVAACSLEPGRFFSMVVEEPYTSDLPYHHAARTCAKPCSILPHI
jgi:hypothetical protein